VRERADDLLLALGRHLRVGHDDGFCAAVRQSRSGVLHGHRAGKAGTFLECDTGRHPASANRRPGSDVVDDKYPTKIELRLIDTDHLYRSDLVGELK